MIMSIDMCKAMSADTCTDMHVDLCIGMSRDTCMDGHANTDVPPTFVCPCRRVCHRRVRHVSLNYAACTGPRAAPKSRCVQTKCAAHGAAPPLMSPIKLVGA